MIPKALTNVNRKHALFSGRKLWYNHSVHMNSKERRTTLMMTVEEIRALGLSEEAIQELTGGADKIEFVRDGMPCPLCGLTETIWYAPATGKHVCMDCHYVF